MDENHKKFLQHLRNSKSAVIFAADIISSLGYSVEINQTKEAPSHDKWKDYIDNGDLIVDGKRVEVKKLGVNFAGKDSWPFKNEFMVCSEHAWYGVSPKPTAFMYISNDYKCYATIYNTSSKFWSSNIRFDKRYGYRPESFLFCPMRYVRFNLIKKDKNESS